MLETLFDLEKYVVHNGYVYKVLPGHDRHTKELLMYSADSTWELCPNTSDAQHCMFAPCTIGLHAPSSLRTDLPTGPGFLKAHIGMVLVYSQDLRQTKGA
jgi:hypothetical protein